jgi:hypothetical protein
LSQEPGAGSPPRWSAPAGRRSAARRPGAIYVPFEEAAMSREVEIFGKAT